MEGEGGARHSRQASSGLPATPAEEPQGTRGQAVYSRSVRPLRTRPACHSDDHRPRSFCGGAGRIGTRSGLDAGGAAPHNARLPRPDPTTAQPQPRVARQPPGALAERSGSERKPEKAAARPGRVGPGLKSYRKFSPTENKLVRTTRVGRSRPVSQVAPGAVRGLPAMAQAAPGAVRGLPAMARYRGSCGHCPRPARSCIEADQRRMSGAERC
jgi:hypothetical protein